MLRYKDLDFRLRFDNDEEYDSTLRQTCRLGAYMSDLEIPDLEVDFSKKSLLFDWKAVLDMFYYDYACVQRWLQNHPTSPKAPAFTFLDRINEQLGTQFAGRTKLSSHSQINWEINRGSEEDIAFLCAFIERLKKSHRKVGEDFDYNGDDFDFDYDDDEDEEDYHSDVNTDPDLELRKRMRRHIKNR